MNLEECNRTDRTTFLCHVGQEKVYVNNVYPPIQELQPRVQLVVVIFVCCFIVGICGNASILTVIRGIMSERKSSGARRRHSKDNAIYYISALCIVDFLMSLSLPPAILDSVIGFWIFGTWVCKLHHVCGSVGRIVSTFLITAMSFDRFVAVCYPHKQYYRSKKFVISTIITLWAIAFILLLPMLTYAASTEVLLHQQRHEDHLTGQTNLTRIRVYKCTDMMPPTVFYWFTSSTFLLGYLVPLVLIIFFNSRLINRLYRHTKVLRRSGIPLRRIATYTILIAVLYFVCWTPYWCSVLYAVGMSLWPEERVDERTSHLLIFIIYCFHLLPYFGSATNWILYGLLNTQLQMRHDLHGPVGGGVTSGTAINNTLAPFGGVHPDDTVSLCTMNAGLKDGLLSSGADRIDRSHSLFSELHKPNGAMLPRSENNSLADTLPSARVQRT
ncbi:G-PROTEIN-RECEP-F1-2 domain-containing protein [Aphelenchoides fujianensis]|nr:G-PROTEIN-RECEP-F1-2 domain-containing protein [Aphelenchoides fujianensis]